jgi:diadenylate cyclase
VGALIVIERRDGLKTYIENGVRLDSAVSYDLLVTLFAPGTPLHDGAVIVSGERIAAASCFLPLSLRESLSKRFGTRHRAAIGITEETDALAIVVSEERGTISMARDGELLDELDAKSLRDTLLREFAASR